MEAETATNGESKKTRKAKPKQLKIKGTERKDRNKAIEKAAAAYVEARDERCELSKVETLNKFIEDAK